MVSWNLVSYWFVWGREGWGGVGGIGRNSPQIAKDIQAWIQKLGWLSMWLDIKRVLAQGTSIYLHIWLPWSYLSFPRQQQGKQEDAEEFLSCLLNGFHDEMIAAIEAAYGSSKPEGM